MPSRVSVTSYVICVTDDRFMSVPIGWSHFRSMLATAAGPTCIAALAIGLTVWRLRVAAINDAHPETELVDIS